MGKTAVANGASFSREFTKSLYDVPDGERIRSCLQCGTCSGVCPFGDFMEWPPGKMIAALRAEVFDEVVASDSAWMCVSCYACTALCPAKIPITRALMTRAKEEMVLAGNVPSELQAALENSQRYGNPIGESARKRSEWTKGMEPAVPVFGPQKREAEVLWFVGDYPSYHLRVQQATRALARVLRRLGVDFAILGPDEQSDGDSQRLAGERGLFEVLAEKNGRALAKYRFGEIITADPHALNALKNEYPGLGIHYPVKHYTQFLAERLDRLQPLLKREVPGTVTYHDPCYLGRANGVFEEPRQLLGAVPGLKLVEMPHHHKVSLCCGGGGGGMWLDGFLWEKTRARTSEWRVREAVQVGAGMLAVACPYEPPRFEDAAKMVKEAGQLKVQEISEILMKAMGD